MLSVVVGWTRVRRTARAGVALLSIGYLALLATYPAIASEPKPRGYQYPPWVTACVIVALASLLVGATLHRVAARWRRERLHKLAALHVQYLPGNPAGPGPWWVRVTDPGTGKTAESSTERTVPANEQRALDLLMEQLGR